MEIINGIDRLPTEGRAVNLALGNFDGVHRGHQAILKAAVEKAKNNGDISAAMIFDPHPIVALRPDNPMLLLTDIVDRAEIMDGLGVDYLIVEQFTENLSSLSPEHFIEEVLLSKMDLRSVFIGPDYSFGHKGAGTSETMCYWGSKHGFEVSISPLLVFNGREVSSSHIRSLLLSGAVKEASAMLNYFFFRQGKVVKGYGIGKEMVYPTANLVSGPRLLWPGKGVYFTLVDNIDSGPRFGVTNVGTRPTFSCFDTSVETHILDFEGSLYNRELRLYFLEKIRDTKTFSSAQHLKDQIRQDIEKCRELIANNWQEKNGISNSLQLALSMLKSS